MVVRFLMKFFIMKKEKVKGSSVMTPSIRRCVCLDSPPIGKVYSCLVDDFIVYL